MKVLVACEESQEVCKAFRKLGHEAYSCDILPCSGGHPEWHIQGDVLEQLDKGWDMMIAHPPCTYLTVTANKWLKDQPPRKSGALVGAERRKARNEAIDFFMKLANANIPKIVIENPVGCMSSVWRKPDQIIQPMDFGHKEPKKTCLWIKGLPKLKATHTGIQPEYTITKSGKRMATWYYYADNTKKSNRSIVRSKTFRGIAEAMARQWGNL
jgi:hypothetical protein